MHPSRRPREGPAGSLQDDSVMTLGGHLSRGSAKLGSCHCSVAHSGVDLGSHHCVSGYVPPVSVPSLAHPIYVEEWLINPIRSNRDSETVDRGLMERGCEDGNLDVSDCMYASCSV